MASECSMFWCAVHAADKFGATPLHEASNWSTHASTVAALVTQGADPHRRDGGGETAAEIITRRGLNMTLDGSGAGSVLIATPVKADGSQKPNPIGSSVAGGGQAAPITPADGNNPRAGPTPTATPSREVVSPTHESPRRGRLMSFGDGNNGAGLGRQVSAGDSQRRPGGVSPPRMAGVAGGAGSTAAAPLPLRQSGSLEGFGATPTRKQVASAAASNANPSPMSDSAAKRAALKAKLERKRQLAAQSQTSAVNGGAPMTPSAATFGPPPTTPPPSQAPPVSPGKHRAHHAKIAHHYGCHGVSSVFILRLRKELI